MRLYQLVENELTPSQQHANEMYEYLKTHCSDFFKLSNGFENVPHRSESINRSTSTPFSEIAKLSTREIRTSQLSKFMDNGIIEMLDVISTSLGNASRINHMVTSSSVGGNPLFQVNEHSPKLFPIGKLKYSYIEDDFNNHTEDLDSDIEIFLQHIIRSKEFSSVDPKQIFHDYKTLYKFYEHIFDEDNELLVPLQFAGLTSEIIIDLLRSIENTNYQQAFNSENEIWFNCKEYFLMPVVDYNLMMEQKTI